MAKLSTPTISVTVTGDKTYRGVSGDTGFTGTSQWVVVPLTSMSTFVINSTGSETVQLVWM